MIFINRTHQTQLPFNSVKLRIRTHKHTLLEKPNSSSKQLIPGSNPKTQFAEALLLLLFCIKTKKSESFGFAWFSGAKRFRTLVSHEKAVICNLSKVGHASQIYLGTVLQRDNDIAPLADKTRHDLHVLDDTVREIAAILTSKARNNGDPEVGESVSEEEGARDGRKSEGEPEKGETQEKIGQEIPVVGPTIEKDAFLIVGFGGGR